MYPEYLALPPGRRRWGYVLCFLLLALTEICLGLYAEKQVRLYTTTGLRFAAPLNEEQLVSVQEHQRGAENEQQIYASFWGQTEKMFLQNMVVPPNRSFVSDTAVMQGIVFRQSIWWEGHRALSVKNVLSHRPLLKRCLEATRLWVCTSLRISKFSESQECFPPGRPSCYTLQQKSCTAPSCKVYHWIPPRPTFLPGVLQQDFRHRKQLYMARNESGLPAVYP